MSRPVVSHRSASSEMPSLRDALGVMPVPAAPDFDDRVLAALRAPLPWWMTLWNASRPIVISAACSLCVTLTLIAWITRAPAGFEPVTVQVLRPAQTLANVSPDAFGDLDRLGHRPPTRANLMAALLAVPQASSPAPLPPMPAKAPEVPRPRRLSCAPCLLA